MSQPIEYIQSRRDETVTDELFGTIVADPYRWLEADTTDEVKDWITDQNKTTASFLEQIPFRAKLCEQMKAAWNYERYSSPFTEGDYIYWFKNDGLQNQSVCYRKSKNDIDGSTEEIFIDPNTFSTDGTSSLAALEFTEDGSKCGYFISHAGSDIRVCRFLDTATKAQIEADELTNIKFSPITWYKNEGIFYSTYDFEKGSSLLTAMTDSHRVFYHKLNTPQSEDVRVFGHKEDQKRRYVGASISPDDNKYLIIYAATSTSGNELYVKQLTSENFDKDTDIKCIVNDFTYDFDFVDCYNDKLYLSTNYKAPMKKLIAIDLIKLFELANTTDNDDLKHIMHYFENHPESGLVTEIIPEADAVLEVSTAGGFFIANYQRVALSSPVQFDYEGKKITEIALPGPGTASGFSAKRKETETYYSFTNYISPNTIYKYDLLSHTSSLHIAPQVKILGLEKFVSEQIFYPSKDGTQIPMILTYNPAKVDLSAPTGDYPLQLYGYGGFNISLSPAFSIPTAIWVANGGIMAVPNLRGGGEYGKAWHKAGTKLQKQNVFDDFIAAAEFLIQKKYTSRDTLMIRGGSNGGLLVGACLTQRPDLFKVAIPMVGVLDMLRYHKFTSGAGWAADFGHAEESKEMFEYLLKYSPLHNVKEDTVYPATMITTGDADDRVSPPHSTKFAAELQSKAKNVKVPQDHPFAPCLIRIDCKAGHGAGKSISSMVEEHTDIQAFALFCMGKAL